MAGGNDVTMQVRIFLLNNRTKRNFHSSILARKINNSRLYEIFSTY